MRDFIQGPPFCIWGVSNSVRVSLIDAWFEVPCMHRVVQAAIYYRTSSRYEERTSACSFFPKWLTLLVQVH